MNIHIKLQYLSLGIATLGIAGMVPVGSQWLQSKIAAPQPIATVSAAAPSAAAHPNLVSGVPRQLTIPTLSISLPVIDGVHEPSTGDWSLSLDKAHFALPSVPANNVEGNTLIYGHNRKGVFATLAQIKPGAKAEVHTDNGFIFVYTFVRTEAVKPTDTSIFTYDGAAQLTIQTCSGAWYQNRQMYYFSLSGYRKA